MYQQVLFRLKVPRSEDALLDLGCCVGQVLRQFRADGVRGDRLYGTDLESLFFDVGYALFRDQAFLDASFVAGDMLDPDDHRLHSLRGKITIVYAGSFFHLFNWIQQLYIGTRLVTFLRKGTKNAVIFGRHIGTKAPRNPSVQSNTPYLHDERSFQKLWDEVGKITGTRWKVQVKKTGQLSTQDFKDISEDVFPMDFTIHQVP